MKKLFRRILAAATALALAAAPYTGLEITAAAEDDGDAVTYADFERDGLVFVQTGEDTLEVKGLAEPSKNVSSVTIPETLKLRGRDDIVRTLTVTSIGELAFYGNYNLLSVYIPNTVKKIRRYAFYEAYRLTAKIPSSVEIIEEYAFTDCQRLQSDVPGNITYIGNNAFNNCFNLAGSITIPACAEYIGRGAFAANRSLKVLTIEGKTKIDYCAFEGCYNLSKINFKDEPVFLDQHIFGGCQNSLKYVINPPADFNISKQYYALSLDTLGGSQEETIIVEKGSTAAVPKHSPTKSGSFFVGWYNDSAYTSEYDFETPVNESKTIYAGWAKLAPSVDEYTVTYDANGGSGKMSSEKAQSGIAFRLPACGFTAPEGKRFKCWAVGSVNGENISAGGQYTFTGRTTVYAVWETDTGSIVGDLNMGLVYRLYNESNQEHLFTTDKNEVRELAETGAWRYEGSAWTSPADGTPVYRLYCSTTKAHLYTSDENEKNALLSNSRLWSIDNGGEPLFYSDASETNAVYRLYNEGIQRHLLTTNKDEYDYLAANGWNGEGVKFFCSLLGDPEEIMP